MKIIFILLLFSFTFLTAGCAFSTETELERRSRELYTQKAQQILKRSVIFVPRGSVHPMTLIPPREYYIQSSPVPQNTMSVADYLQTCSDGDREQQAKEIVSYYHQRDLAKLQAEFNNIKIPGWLKEREQEITALTLACMKRLLAQ